MKKYNKTLKAIKLNYGEHSEYYKDVKELIYKCMLDKFLEELETSYDSAIEYIKENTEDKQLLEYVNNYYKGYEYCIDNDIDSGKCFEMRAKAIENIIDYLYISSKLENVEV